MREAYGLFGNRFGREAAVFRDVRTDGAAGSPEREFGSKAIPSGTLKVPALESRVQARDAAVQEYRPPLEPRQSIATSRSDFRLA